MQEEFSDAVSLLPGRRDLIEHHIETLPGLVVHSYPYWLPEHTKNMVRDGFKAMLKMGVVREAHSDWISLMADGLGAQDRWMGQSVFVCTLERSMWCLNLTHSRCLALMNCLIG